MYVKAAVLEGPALYIQNIQYMYVILPDPGTRVRLGCLFFVNIFSEKFVYLSKKNVTHM